MVLSKKAIAGVAAIAGVLALLLVVATLTAKGDAPRALRVVLAQLELKAENTVSVWVSSALLAAVALACGIAFLVDRRGAMPVPGTGLTGVLRYGWLAMALVFALLSFDEMGSIHERVHLLLGSDRVPSGVGDIQSPWVRQLIVPICLVAAFMLTFAWKRLREVPAAFACLACGVVMFLLIPVQETIHAGWYSDALAAGRGSGYRTPSIHTVLEEGGELSGSILFLVGTLLFVSDRAPHHSAQTLFASVPAVSLVIVMCMISGFVLMLALMGELVFLHDKQGSPQNWFPSMTALLCAVGCFAASRYAERDRYLPWGLRLLGLMSILLSVDHATDHRLISRSLRHLVVGVPLGHFPVPFCLAAAAAFVTINSRSTALKLGVWTWVLLVTLGFSNGPVARTTVGLLAYCVFLLGISVFLSTKALGKAPGRPEMASARAPATRVAE